VPAATVTMTTSALLQTLVQTNVCAITARLPNRLHATVEYLRQATPDFISPDVWPNNCPNLNPVDYRIWGCLQTETAPG